MAEPAFSICVYCGSRPGEGAAFAQAAAAVGQWIGSHGGQLVYGGGRSGLMGTVAEATRLAGGRVVGVIPQTLVDKELANQQCDELHIVQTMHERKAKMAELADGFIAMPGGFGTFEEWFEVLTWSQLGMHSKPIGLLNTAAYYAELTGFIARAIGDGFVGERESRLLQVADTPAALLDLLACQPGQPGGEWSRS